MEENSVPFFKSKTMWSSVAVAVAGNIPAVKEVVANDPGLVTTILGALFAILRVISAGKISVK